PPLPFADNFSQAHLSGLGNPWSVDQGGFNIVSNQAVAAAALLSEATLYGTSLTTVDESANIVTEGTSAGLLARWNSATQTGYAVELIGTTLKVFSVVNGTATQIGPTVTTAASTGTLRFTISGTTLQVYFNGTALFSGSGITDGTIPGPGTVGLFSGGSSA